ncbi:adenylyl cyclase alpha, putative, partial [Hepatocystis sp. ex Piliocolobus tephrosceles]
AEIIKLINLNMYDNNQNNEEVIILDNSIKNLNELRYYEMKTYESKDFTFYVDIKKNIRKKIAYVFFLKVFIIVLSIIITKYFSAELNTLLFPIEGILKKLKLMKTNPTLALEMQEELLNHELNTMLASANLKKYSIKEDFEILKMEENLMKLGTLMLLGFGEAGAKMISKNINEEERINLLVNGEIVYSVFSFCDIRNFTEITEMLKEKIMIFINLVAEIIHECCDFYGGSVNKNIGDAFLLVWKYDKKYVPHTNYNYSKQGGGINDYNIYDDSSDKENIKRICDSAFVSTVRTLIKLQQSEKIHLFLQNENMGQLINKNVIELSFGLHFGWAIEGAIGSTYKIDLSYLSENVNIASRLQDISKIYKNNIVISDDFYNNLSDNFKRELRKIDRVTLKGCKNPLILYTFDMKLNEIQVKKNLDKSDTFHFPLKKSKKLTKILDDIRIKTERKRRKRELSNFTYDLYKEFATSKEIQSIKVGYAAEYLELFQNALELYLNGNWNDSKKLLEYLRTNFNIEDHIVYQLLNFMNMTNFITPYDWCGYRKFLQKS